MPRSGLLSHVTVLDITNFLAGPYGSQVMADMGARVIKIEPPDGDITRTRITCLATQCKKSRSKSLSSEMAPLRHLHFHFRMV